MATVLSSYTYAPVFRIEIEGTLLSPAAVISVSIDENLETPSKFDIALNEGLDVKTQSFTWLDNPVVNPGNKVQIYFGYPVYISKNPMIGTIKALSPSFQSAGIPSLTIEGYDLSHSMQKKMNKVNDEEVTFSDIARELATKLYNLKTDGIEATEEKHKKVQREKGQNDRDFLKDLAKKIGYEFFVQGDTLYFRKPKDDKEPVKTFTYRKNFIRFSPRLSTASLVSEVVVTDNDEKTKEKIEGKAELRELIRGSQVERLIKDAEGLEPRKIENKPLKSVEEAKSIAEVELKKALNSFIQGTLECIGDPDLRPGICIEIEGLGELFSGKYYITSAKHSLDNNGYKTSLGVRRILR
jgi:phage protein D